MDDTRALLSFASALAYSDGHVSDEEFGLLFHIACRFVSAKEAQEQIALFAAKSGEERTSDLNAAIAFIRQRPYTERLVFLLYGYDFAAVDGVSAAEQSMLISACQALGVRAVDERRLRRAVNPKMPRATPAEGEKVAAEIRVVHVGRQGLPLPLRAGLTLVEVGDRRFLRIFDADDAVLLDGEPAPRNALIEIWEESRITVSPYVLRPAEVGSLIGTSDAVWSAVSVSVVTGSATLSESLSLWRLGPLLSVESKRLGIAINGDVLPVGQRRVLLSVDKLSVDGKALHLDTGLWSQSSLSWGLNGDTNSSIDLPELGTAIVRRARGIGAEGAIDGLHVRSLSVEVGGKRLVDDISFDVEKGELVALIGPSGCGKTTLLEACSGRLQPKDGQLLARSGFQLTPLANASSRLAMVPQDEILLPQLTVRENLELACRLRLPLLDADAVRGITEECIAQVGLTARADMRVGNPARRLLSGGQRKRVSVGVELVGKPEVLLLDEPLSGLSSHDARNMMVLFLDLARRGRIVMVVVHQPSAELFSYFDKVLVMDRGGKLAFFGTPADAIDYFASHGQDASAASADAHPNVILATMEQLRAAGRWRSKRAGPPQRVYPPEYWQSLYLLRHPDRKLGALHAQDEGPSSGRTLKSRIAQLSTVLERHVVSRIRNVSALALSFFVGPFLGLLLGGVLRFVIGDEAYRFGMNPNGLHFLFLVPVVTFFLGMTGSCTEFIMERRFLKHERPLGVPPHYFLASKLTLLLVWCAVETALFLAAACTVLEVPGPYGWLFVLSFLTCCVGATFGLLVSATTSHIRVAHSFVPLVMIPQLLFGGLIPYDKMNPMVYLSEEANRADAPLVGQLMPVRWAYEGLVVAFASRNPFAEKGGTAELEALRVEERALAKQIRAEPPEITEEAFGAARERIFQARAALMEKRDEVESGVVRAAVSAAARAQQKEDAVGPNAFRAPQRVLWGTRMSADWAAFFVLLQMLTLFVVLSAGALHWRARR